MRKEIKEIISKYNQGYDDLQDAIREIPAEVWDFKPAPGKWSIREIVAHLTDCEANAFVRCRKIIAESGSAVTPYNQDLWANNLLYESRSIDSNLELFKNIRLINTALFLDLNEEAWNRHMIHPEHGMVTLKEYVPDMSKHLDVHIKQMKRNLKAWNEQS